MSLVNFAIVATEEYRSEVSSLSKSLFLALLCVLGATGCSRAPRAYQVQGTVAFPDGKPVHVGTIELRSRTQPVQARGQIATDGTFTLTTYEPGDGAIEGLHDCVIVQMVMVEELPSHKPSGYGLIDPKYASYKTSGLEVSINAKEQNQVNLVVERMRDFRGRISDVHDHKPDN